MIASEFAARDTGCYSDGQAAARYPFFGAILDSEFGASGTNIAQVNTRAKTGPVALFVARMESPIGRVEVTGDGEAVTSLSIERTSHAVESELTRRGSTHRIGLPHDGLPENPDDVLAEAINQLQEYFAGTLRSFDLPLSLDGTEFQRQVWSQIGALEFGCSTSYGYIAHEIDRPTAGRAVGTAVGTNPIPLIVPCHRVLAGDRKVTGYSAGNGIATKLWLLHHEGISAR